MGQLAFFIMALIAPCLISAYGGDGSPKAIVQKISGLEKFVPPQQGCVATIVSDLYCPWCTEMHLQMKRIMAKNYVPTIDYRGTTAIMTQSKDPNFRMRHMKVTCFVNYLITDNFKGLGHVFNPQLLRYLKGKEWFVFIKGERKKEFLKCWANEIDANFGRVFPRIALVMRNPDENEGNALHPLARAFENLAKGEFSMAFSCYLCGEGHYFVYDESTSSNPWNLMQRTKEVTGNNAPIGESPENQYFNSWRPYPAEMVNLEAIMMFAIQQHVNYSFVQGEKSIGIYFHTAQAVGENEEVVEAFRSGFIPFKSVFLSKDAYSLGYCRSQHTNKYFTALVSPFDGASWVLLIAFLASFCLVSGLRVWYSFNVIWQFLCQPPQGKRIGVLLILVAIVLFPIQCLYKEYFASNAMTPYKMELLDTNQKVFDSKFKYICSDVTDCVNNPRLYLSPTSGTLTLDWETPKQYFIGVEKPEFQDEAKIIASTKDEGTFPIWRNYKENALLRAESLYPDTKCYMAEQYWFALTTSFQFSGPLSQAMFDTFRRFREVGIFNFWTQAVKKFENLQYKRTFAESSDEIGFEDDGGMEHMNRTLMSLGVVFLGGLVVSLLVLVAEILSVKIAALFNRWRERRRYLRAIWPLGKI